MGLSAFPYLQDNTRLVQHENNLYKLKIRYNRESFQDEGFQLSETEAHSEIEQSFRAVLYKLLNDGSVLPIQTPHFLIKPHLVPWNFPRIYGNYQFQRHGERLKVFASMIEFHITFKKDKYVNRELVTTHPGPSKAAEGHEKGQDNDRDIDLDVASLVEAHAASSKLYVSRFGRTRDGKLYRVVSEKNKTHSKAETSLELETSKEKTLKPVTKTNVPKTQAKAVQNDAKQRTKLTLQKQQTAQKAKVIPSKLRRKYALRERNPTPKSIFSQRLRSRIDIKNRNTRYSIKNRHVGGKKYSGSQGGSQKSRNINHTATRHSPRLEVHKTRDSKSQQKSNEQVEIGIVETKSNLDTEVETESEYSDQEKPEQLAEGSKMIGQNFSTNENKTFPKIKLQRIQMTDYVHKTQRSPVRVLRQSVRLSHPGDPKVTSSQNRKRRQTDVDTDEGRMGLFLHWQYFKRLYFRRHYIWHK